MKRLLFTVIVGLVAIPVVGQTNSWKGLTPLRSTREQVENLFGKPNPERKYINEYKVGDIYVEVEYSQKLCEYGWNVPVGSVLSFRVSDPLRVNKSADELKLDRKDYFISGDDAMFGTWTEPVFGVQYYFRNMSQSLVDVRYIPRLEDNDSLRCDGFPPFTPEAQYYTMSTVLLHNPKRNKRDDKFDPVYPLDNALYHARKNPGGRLYVLIYFDDKLTIKEYRRRVNFLKNWMDIRWKTKPGEITFIEGGLQEENSMEFYFIPRDWKAPAPQPTLPSPQFRRQKAAKSAT